MANNDDNIKSSNDLNLDDLRHAWQSQQLHAPESDGVPRHASNRAGAFSEQLARRYRTFTAISILWAIIVFPLSHTIHFPMWMTLWMSAYFVVMAVSHALYRDQILKIDFGRMTLVEALDAVIGLRTAETRRIIFGICMAVPLLSCMMFHFFGESDAMFEGGIIGIIIGSFAGWRMSCRNRWFIRKMQDTLRNARP